MSAANMIALSITAPIPDATASPSLTAEISGSVTVPPDERRRVMNELPDPARRRRAPEQPEE
jgi:hypothetical protein